MPSHKKAVRGGKYCHLLCYFCNIFLQADVLCYSQIGSICISVVCLHTRLKGLSIIDTSVGPGADPGLQAVSPQVTVSHPPGGRLPLLSARPAVTFPAAEHHHPLAGTKLYCLVRGAHWCEQLAQGCYAVLTEICITKYSNNTKCY